MFFSSLLCVFLFSPSHSNTSKKSQQSSCKGFGFWRLCCASWMNPSPVLTQIGEDRRAQILSQLLRRCTCETICSLSSYPKFLLPVLARAWLCLLCQGTVPGMGRATSFAWGSLGHAKQSCPLASLGPGSRRVTAAGCAIPVSPLKAGTVQAVGTPVRG